MMEDLKEKETKIVEYVISKFKDNMDSIVQNINATSKDKGVVEIFIKDFDFRICFYHPILNEVGYITHKNGSLLELAPTNKLKLLEFWKFLTPNSYIKQSNSDIGWKEDIIDTMYKYIPGE